MIFCSLPPTTCWDASCRMPNFWPVGGRLGRHLAGLHNKLNTGRLGRLLAGLHNKPNTRLLGSPLGGRPVAERFKKIYVYAHWEAMSEAELMGVLSVSESRGKEIFSFEYDSAWLESQFGFLMDPDLQFYSGPQYVRGQKPNFGIFTDSAPDRWGRMLIKRREAHEAQLNQRAEKRLSESDFLLGVYDGCRIGGLRFKTDEKGDFLDNNHDFATPPWTSLRELEHASLKIEEDNSEKNSSYGEWLKLLVVPGSSLGGARPKAGIVDPEKELWIAKFPDRRDSRDTGAWEMIAHDLAIRAGIRISEAKLESFTSRYHSFLTKRFDRTAAGDRIHFSSAMTMLGYTDGTDAAAGAGYLEIAEFLIRNGADPDEDLKQLWKRIVFNIAVSNTDDHLRNHGFLLSPQGWRLSPAFDINPEPNGYGLSLNITETDNRLDADLALEVAPFFRVDPIEGKKFIKEMRDIVHDWSTLADGYGISSFEQKIMSGAFRPLSSPV